MVRGKVKSKIEEPAVTNSAETVRRSLRRQNQENSDKEKTAIKNKIPSLPTKSNRTNKGTKLGKENAKVPEGTEKLSTEKKAKKNVSKNSTTEAADNSTSTKRVTGTRIRKKVQREISPGPDLSIVKDSSNNVEPQKDKLQLPPKKRRLSNLKIAEEFESPVKKVKMNSPAPPTTKNAVKSPKKRYTSIASSISKTGIVANKNVPRKTLCNMDIIGLLDDEMDEDQESEEIPADKEGSKEDDEADPEISFKDQSSVGSKASKVPVWRKQNTNDESNVAGEDVFDPRNYGEEEFGPDKDNVVKKKARKKKKDTKAILTWGKKKTQDVRTAVKLTHNLETPGRKKTKPKRTNRKAAVAELAPLVLEDPPEVVPSIIVSCDNTDVSHGAQNFFDSMSQPPEVNTRSTSHLQLNSSKAYRTPLIPKTISRFKDNSSTPNASQKSTVTATMSVKELVKNAFGFDSEEELSETDTTGLTISPVRGLGPQSNLPSNKQRDSIFPIVSRANNPKPFRVNIQSRKARVEQNLFAQVKAMREKELTASNLDKKKQPRRVSPRKGGPRKGPILCSTLLDVAEPRQRSVKEMFESSNKRQQKSVEESLSESEASSLYEDIEPLHEVTGAADNEEEVEEETRSRVSDKENTDNTNMDSPKKSLKPLKPAVSRVYKKKTVNQSSVANFVSFDQSSSVVSPKKETRKDKQMKEWAKHQTSHFSEVEDFDLSFS